MKPSPTEKKLLHYTGKAIANYQMINAGDKVMVCLSGGKDSFTLLKILHLLQLRTNNKFTIFAFMLDQGLPNWDDAKVQQWLIAKHIPHEILRSDTLSIIKEKIAPGDNYCSFCSRLRRGIIYNYAKKNNFNKIALGHHRDDLITSLLMSILYNGNISSMPPKLLTDDKRNIIIRPLAYCQEKDIIKYAEEQNFPLLNSESLCEFKNDAVRRKTKALIAELAKDNPKIPSNILHALQCVKPSKLMDKKLVDFRNLEKEIIS